MPNFFCTATAAPGLIDELWAFTKSAYVDSPLPSLFKERLFVYFSRFCAVRYCIVRHVGFLIGEGRPAGDTTALPETIDAPRYASEEAGDRPALALRCLQAHLHARPRRTAQQNISLAYDPRRAHGLRPWLYA